MRGSQINILSQCMTKPTKWHVCPAKTQISLGECLIWVSAGRTCNFVGFVLRWFICCFLITTWKSYIVDIKNMVLWRKLNCLEPLLTWSCTGPGFKLYVCACVSFKLCLASYLFSSTYMYVCSVLCWLFLVLSPVTIKQTFLICFNAHSNTARLYPSDDGSIFMRNCCPTLFEWHSRQD